MDYWSLILLFISCWLLQISLTYQQHKNYHATVNKIKRRHSGSLGIGVTKAKFKLGKGVIILLVTDAKNTILEYHEMIGFTVFARFKEKKQFIGTPTESVLPMLGTNRQKQAFTQALTLINSEKQKTEE